MTDNLRVMRIDDVMNRTGLARASIYKYALNQTFPQQVQLGRGGAVGWLEHEVNAWVREQIDKSRGTTANA
ncbi:MULTISPECIES: helix-turn-helix transcriptional regulator [unclassified Pseudomonas]|uniref:helix-turn-helix transcriptional regulator n=1 Tax=unclassified Pseudomonas TaxID=196821 RepID=UPI001CCCFEA7|nr:MULTISPECIES: AlpA family phage regulatory protein [unclassified Pseudomonas]